jgi:hypothetical protein
VEIVGAQDDPNEEPIVETVGAQDDPNEEAIVETVGAQDDRSEDPRPAIVCRKSWKRRTRGNFAAEASEEPTVEKRQLGAECNNGIRTDS